MIFNHDPGNTSSRPVSEHAEQDIFIKDYEVAETGPRFG